MIAPSLVTKPHDHATDSSVTCQNCGHEYAGYYCSQCGQRADTHRINWHYLWHDIPHSVWHVDQGIAFTLRELLTRPGHSIREFLAGKRINHYRPLALLLLLGAIVVFASHSLNVSFAERSQEMFGGSAADASDRMKAVQHDVNQFVEKNQNLLHIVMIPLYALWFWLLFRRRGYNYPEMLVAQTFVANFNLVVSLVVVLLFWALGGSVSAFSFVMSLTLLAMMAYNALVYMQLFKGELRPRATVVRAVAAYVLSYLSFTLLIGIIVIGYAFFLKSGFKPSEQPQRTAVTAQQPHP